VIPASYNNKPVYRIAADAFAGRSGITGVVLPSTVETVGEGAFAGCTGLPQKDGIYYAGDWAVAADPTITDAVLRAGTRGIAAEAFAASHALVRVYVPATLKYSNKNAFEDCPKLSALTVESIIAWCGVTFSNVNANPLSQAQKLYVGGQLVTELAIPDGVDLIMPWAFYGCTSITKLTLPESIEILGAACFKNCTALTEIYYNAAVATAAEVGWVFVNAGRDGAGITVYVGERVRSIPRQLFYGTEGSEAPKVVSVIFDEESACTQIGEQAFGGCSELASVYMPSALCTGWRAGFIGYTDIDAADMADPVTLAELLRVTYRGYTFERVTE
jgi:hypothetical protein